MDGIWYSLKRIETASFKSYILDDFAAICLRNSDPFYLVIYYVKWVNTYHEHTVIAKLSIILLQWMYNIGTHGQDTVFFTEAVGQDLLNIL